MECREEGLFCAPQRVPMAHSRAGPALGFSNRAPTSLCHGLLQGLWMDGQGGASVAKLPDLPQVQRPQL